MLASECGYKLVVHGALNVFLLHGCSAVDSLIQHDCVWGIAALSIYQVSCPSKRTFSPIIYCPSWLSIHSFTLWFLSTFAPFKLWFSWILVHNPESVVAGGLYIVDVLGHSTKLAVNDGTENLIAVPCYSGSQALCHNLSCLVRSLFGNLSFDVSFFEASRQWE